MDYAEARETFFRPRAPDAPPPALPSRSPARRLRDAIEPLAAICWWSELAYDAYAALGLDFLEGYIYSRASTLGDADPGVVAAAFAVFEPGVIEGALGSARSKASLEQIRAARLDGAVTSLRAVLGDEVDRAPDGSAAASRRSARSAAHPAGPLGPPAIASTQRRPSRGALRASAASARSMPFSGWTRPTWTASASRGETPSCLRSASPTDRSPGEKTAASTPPGQRAGERAHVHVHAAGPPRAGRSQRRGVPADERDPGAHADRSARIYAVGVG